MARKLRTGRKPEEQKRGTPAYMTTYGDMMTLLLIFFIFLFNVGKVSEFKYKMAIASFRQSLGVFPSSISVLRPDEVLLIPKEKGTKNFWGEQKEMNELKKELEAQIKEMLDKGPGYGKVNVGEKDIQITVGDRGLFDSGSDGLKPSILPFIDKVAEIVKKYKLNVLVEGHTDDRPISSARFPSNWELSSGRATSVIRYLIDKQGIAPDNLIATGYADTKPKALNDTAENRAINRRIEIKLSPTDETPLGGFEAVQKDIFQGAEF
ncbi:MAG: OmpA family protein [bacterium]